MVKTSVYIISLEKYC